MESFYINSQRIEVIREGELKPIMEEGFKFYVLGRAEWDQVPLLLTEHIIEQPAWTEFLRMRVFNESQAKSKEGGLAFRPHFEQLSQGVIYICFRDLDEEMNERSIRFFISSNEFVLLGWEGFTADRLSEWAQRGTITNPIELACSFALRVLRHYQMRLEVIEDQMDLIEEEILMATSSWQMQRIISLHRLLLGLKRSLNANKNVIARLKNIQKSLHGDLQDELMFEMEHVTNNAHHTYEMIENLRGAYQAAVDNRANDIMKMLTLVATIILPITLLTGFFGMNFNVMPFVNQWYGIFAFYGLSTIIFLVVMIYFWKKKWLK